MCCIADHVKLGPKMPEAVTSFGKHRATGNSINTHRHTQYFKAILIGLHELADVRSESPNKTFGGLKRWFYQADARCQTSCNVLKALEDKVADS